MNIRCLFDKQVSLSELRAHPKNRNVHPPDQIKRLAEILAYQGWRYPVKVSKRSGFVTSGHGRIEAAKLNGWTEVPVNFQDYESDEQEYADVQADNAIASWAELDLSGINSDIGDLGPDFNLDLLGIKDFVLEPAQLEPGCDEDAVPEHVEPKTKRGDIYQLGRHRLMCGDSTSIDDVEKLMAGEKADMVFTDPPYGVDYKGINNDSRDGLSDLLGQAFANYSCVVKPGSAVYVFHSDRCADIFHEVFRRHCHFSSMIIWAKPALVLSQTDYQSKHEPCLYGWMLGGTHVFYGDRKQTSIWEFGKESVAGHTTPKPVALIENALANSSKPEALVVDLFGGSGSTMVACEKTNRRCFMMELDPHYCDVIVARWEKYTGKKAELLDG